MNKKTIIILAVVILVAVTLIGASTLFLTQNQDNRSGASGPTPPIIPPTAIPLQTSVQSTDTGTPTPSPTDALADATTPTPTASQQSTCSQPSAVTNVKVSYPYVDPTNQASFVQAGCSWDAQADAASYALTVTEVETNTIVMQQNVPAGTTNVSFNINQNKTYKCDVSAVNSCGSVSVASSDQLLCEANGLVESPTPTTPPPTLTAAPTQVASPTATETPRPTLAPTGSADSLFIGIAIAAGIILFGGFLFVL